MILMTHFLSDMAALNLPSTVKMLSIQCWFHHMTVSALCKQSLMKTTEHSWRNVLILQFVQHAFQKIGKK